MAENVMAGTYDENGPAREPDGAVMRGRNHRLFMRLFIAQDAMTFLVILAAYIALRIGAGGAWPPASKQLAAPLAAGMTAALLLTSYAMFRAVTSVRRGALRTLRPWLAVAIAGGALFLAGQTTEYVHLIGAAGMRPARSLFDATFLTLTGFHGLHVLAGVIYLTVIAARAGAHSPERHEGLAAAGLYWHFVDAVWLLLFLLIYIV